MAKLTPEGRFAFVTIITPKAMPGQANAEPKYSVRIVFDPKTDVSNVVESIVEAAQEKWGEKAKEMLKSGALRNPLRRQAEKSHIQGHGTEGYYIDLRNNEAPGVVDSKANPILDKTQVKAGMLGRASYRCYAYDKAGNKGVGIGLGNLQVLRDDGTRWDGRTEATDDFEAMAGDDGFEAQEGMPVTANAAGAVQGATKPVAATDPEELFS